VVDPGPTGVVYSAPSTPQRDLRGRGRACALEEERAGKNGQKTDKKAYLGKIIPYHQFPDLPLIQIEYNKITT